MVDRLTREDFNLSQRSTYTVIRFLRVSSKFGTCTVVRVYGTLVEDEMRRFKGECASASANFSTNSHETDNSVRSAYTVIRFVSISAKFGSCTVVGLNGTLVEAKIRTWDP